MRQKKTTKPLTYGYLPVNLDANELINVTHGSGLRYRALILFKVILNQYRSRYSTSTPDYTEPVPLHSRYVEKILGERKASDGIDLLVNAGLLNSTNYKFDLADPTNNYSRSFSIPAHLLHIDLFGESRYYTKIPIFDKKAATAEKCYRKERIKGSLEKYPEDDVMARLADALDDVYLDLTSTEAKNIIEERGLANEVNGFSNLMHMELVNQRDIFWFKRDKYGRLHNPWVSLNKKGHPLIRFKGYDTERCGELDIANAQPYFSSIINQEVIRRMLPEAADLVAGIDFHTPVWQEYRNLCIGGKFYEHWIDVLRGFFGEEWQDYFAQQQELEYAAKNAKRKAAGKKPKKPKCNYSTASPRQVAKSLFYIVIFGTQPEGCEIGECFRGRFPDVYEAFRIIKCKHCPHNPSKKNKKGKPSYTNVVWIMQRLESLVVIDTAVRSLLDKNITQLISRHDSLMAPESLMSEVEMELKMAFERWELPVPTIK
ncbi:hypothetical protein [Rufibacter latericius]|uniref:Uncharacterized protein n=1 Tax=Rufibacter latericius TaxID=2487040 RepID=A0A3M9MAT3_9BACT|nr:hypothetical protein [Rufibacter latericius]RNI22651.1 hypothetical protein EFB08_21390 [Rufibacter latericius]